VLVEVETYRQIISTAFQKVREAGPTIVRQVRADPVGISNIERDPEVAAFLRERFLKRYTLEELHAGCIEQFGAERTPSIARIGKFRKRYLEAR
jgi:hypothetical protein